MNKPLESLRSFSRRVSQEGIVLLENKNDILPIVNKKVALFGRIQFNYYKSGTGSGGLVNVTDTPSFVDAARENPRITINEDLLNAYLLWLSNNPFNAGNGMWASEPWAQEEYSIDISKIRKLKKEDEIPIVIIGRTAGEDRDNDLKEGSYFLTKEEKELLKNVKEVYGNLVLVLNVGNIIDMTYINSLNIDSILYVWHGGQDGARATFDVITGYFNPSGKLPDTIPYDLYKYPATRSFGNKEKIYYEEDIYVGYRYYQTFDSKNILYPFGYGISYTDFSFNDHKFMIDDKNILVETKVENIGKFTGKEVVQLYISKPQGKLGKPFVELVGFAKTKQIKPNEIETIKIEIDLNKNASYDDVGLVSKSSYVLEEGEYKFYLGKNSNDLTYIGSKIIDKDIVVKSLEEALAPTEKFNRIKPIVENNKVISLYEEVPTRKINLQERIKNESKKETFKNDLKGIKLIDVYNEKYSINEFVGTLTDEELMDIVFGEGMSSPKVTPGTASAFGGITESLKSKGIPVVCCADGPSGIRMDSGALATSLPNGTLIASTFNPNLIEDLYFLEANEMKNYNIDIILGPGMNIHRHPLNGRNFEYFSEDPLLTGIMASSVVRGLNRGGVSGAMKHFIANNQETARTEANSIISERAIREIYLKGFEIAVKESNADVIMTSYNPVNNIWAASNFDLNTQVLRKEWGFKGIVMTDWWAKMNYDGEEGTKTNIAAMVKSQNDLYMVVPNVKDYHNNLEDEYNNGVVTRYELERSAINILEFILKSRVFKNSNNLIVEDYSTYNHWFKNSSFKNKYSFLTNKDLINQVTYFNEIDFLNDNVSHLKEHKNNITYLLIEDDENTLYTFGVKSNIKEENILKEVLKVESNQLIEVPKEYWTSTDVDLENPFYCNNKNSWLDIEKDSIYTYKIKVSEYGKFLIHIELSSNMPNENQMPFSIYVDNQNRQTLTINGTNGQKNYIKGDVILNTENKYITFKFLKTGINIHSIRIEKHG